jgi:adenosylcobyric acid synthase
VRYVTSPAEIRDPSLIVLPGSKTTVDDLAWLRESGLAKVITEQRNNGTPVLGICGGFQMLGEAIHDPGHVESNHGTVAGLGLLPMSTHFRPAKTTRHVRGRIVAPRGMFAQCDFGGSADIGGYEIHMGTTINIPRQPQQYQALLQLTDASGTVSTDGAIDNDGLTAGTYLHGIFHNEHLRHQLIATLAARRGIALTGTLPSYDVNKSLDTLAAHVREHLDMDHIYALINADPE